MEDKRNNEVQRPHICLHILLVSGEFVVMGGCLLLVWALGLQLWLGSE